jgi:hypothetical protein
MYFAGEGEILIWISSSLTLHSPQSYILPQDYVKVDASIRQGIEEQALEISE